jgi:4-hydroxy-tetrahydrodipicolinate synthase
LRRRLVEITVASAAGRVPVYAGVSGNCVPEVIESGNGFLRMGVDAVVAHLPYYYLLTRTEMQSYFELLAHSINGPLILYNIPPTTHMSLPLELLDRLSALPNIVGCKDSERDLERMQNMAKRLGGRPDFALFMGISAFSVRALRLGFDGLVPSSGNLAPELWEILTRHAALGDWDRAESTQARLDAVAQVFQRNRTLGQSLAALKTAMSHRGFCRPDVLPPLQPLSASEEAALRAELIALGLIGKAYEHAATA